MRIKIILILLFINTFYLFSQSLDISFQAGSGLVGTLSQKSALRYLSFLSRDYRKNLSTGLTLHYVPNNFPVSANTGFIYKLQYDAGDKKIAVYQLPLGFDFAINKKRVFIPDVACILML